MEPEGSLPHSVHATCPYPDKNNIIENTTDLRLHETNISLLIL